MSYGAEHGAGELFPEFLQPASEVQAETRQREMQQVEGRIAANALSDKVVVDMPSTSTRRRRERGTSAERSYAAFTFDGFVEAHQGSLFSSDDLLKGLSVGAANENDLAELTERLYKHPLYVGWQESGIIAKNPEQKEVYERLTALTQESLDKLFVIARGGDIRHGPFMMSVSRGNEEVHGRHLRREEKRIVRSLLDHDPRVDWTMMSALEGAGFDRALRYSPDSGLAERVLQARIHRETTKPEIDCVALKHLQRGFPVGEHMVDSQYLENIVYRHSDITLVEDGEAVSCIIVGGQASERKILSSLLTFAYQELIKMDKVYGSEPFMLAELYDQILADVPAGYRFSGYRRSFPFFLNKFISIHPRVKRSFDERARNLIRYVPVSSTNANEAELQKDVVEQEQRIQELCAVLERIFDPELAKDPGAISIQPISSLRRLLLQDLGMGLSKKDLRVALDSARVATLVEESDVVLLGGQESKRRLLADFAQDAQNVARHLAEEDGFTPYPIGKLHKAMISRCQVKGTLYGPMFRRIAVEVIEYGSDMTISLGDGNKKFVRVFPPKLGTSDLETSVTSSSCALAGIAKELTNELSTMQQVVTIPREKFILLLRSRADELSDSQFADELDKALLPYCQKDNPDYLKLS